MEETFTTAMKSSGRCFFWRIIQLATVLNAAYFLPIVWRAFWRPVPIDSPPHGEGPRASVLALTVTAALTLTLFVYPDIVLALASAALPTEGAQ